MELYDIKVSNFGPYKKFELSLYKQGLIWIGGINNDTEAADSNGSGKSSIFKALTWGLYGETIDGEKGDNVIRSGSSKAVVDIRLIDNKKEYWTISRQRTKGSPRIKLLRPDGSVFEGGKQEIQERITNMIGLDFKTFKNTVLYGQNDSSRFANPNTKDSERKLMLHKILNTELLACCYEKVLKSAKVIKDSLRSLSDELDKQKIMIDEIDVKDLERRYDLYERTRSMRIESFKTQALEYRKEAKGLLSQLDNEDEVCEEDVEEISKRIIEKQKQIDLVEQAERKAEQLSKEVEKAESIYADFSTSLASTDKEREECSKKLKRLKGDKCPLCSSSLKDGEASLYINEIKNELATIEKTLAVIKIIMSERKIDLDEIVSSYQTEKNIARRLPGLLREMNELNGDLSEIKRKLADAENKRERIREKAKSFVERAKNELSMIRKEKEIENPYTEQMEIAEAKLRTYEKNILAIESERNRKNEELSYYDFWAKGFSNKGLPSYILDSVMPYITERTNHYLGVLTDNDISLEFSTQRELKSAKGEMRDEIDLRWRIEGNDMYPPSGGQLKKMEIASDLALMDLVASNEGGNLDIIMMDEVLDGLDSEGCSRVLLLLQKLRARRGSIFVISHESKMAEAFEKGLYAVKDDGIAVLEKI